MMRAAPSLDESERSAHADQTAYCVTRFRFSRDVTLRSTPFFPKLDRSIDPRSPGHFREHEGKKLNKLVPDCVHRSESIPIYFIVPPGITSAQLHRTRIGQGRNR